MCAHCDESRERIIDAVARNPTPCVVCRSTEIVGIGTWMPGPTERLAAGAYGDEQPVFAFWLCERHAQIDESHKKLITQAVLREFQQGNAYEEK